MIYIYTNKSDSKNWIIQNDLFFNLNTANDEMTDIDKEMIKKVDNAILKPDKRIETIYGLGTIRNLSSGCKTLLNILKYSDKIVCVDECGKNVLDIIFTLEKPKIYMSKPSIVDIMEGTRICFNNKDIVVGNKGYYEWWSKEYERRQEDDL